MLLNVVNKRAGEPQKLIVLLTIIIGEEIASILPTLKFRQAVAAGKAFASTVPMIFEVSEIKGENKNGE